MPATDAPARDDRDRVRPARTMIEHQALGGEPAVILWTIQTDAAWTVARRRGVLVGDARRVCADHRSAYRWLTAVMRRCLPPPCRRVTTPIWAWRRWRTESARPDLRSRGHVPAGVRAVCLEFRMDPEHVLMSDFLAWHYALNGWYLPRNEAGERRFEAWLRRRGLDPAQTRTLRDTSVRRAIERSWHRMFLLDEGASVQACVWQVPLSAVTRVRTFVGR
jgi:hypothetical protein